MPENYIELIKESTLFVFGKVLKEKKIEVEKVNQPEDYFDLSSTISISNASLKILVTMGCNLESSKFYAKHFLRMKVEPNEELVNSSISELTNIIAGDTKKRMQISDLILGLPQSVQGHSHRLVFENKEIKIFKYIYHIDEFQFKQIIQITANENA